VADGVHYRAPMTRFDRTWEPLVFIAIAAVFWFATL
jgi:hypothetical protein